MELEEIFDILTAEGFGLVFTDGSSEEMVGMGRVRTRYGYSIGRMGTRFRPQAPGKYENIYAKQTT